MDRMIPDQDRRILEDQKIMEEAIKAEEIVRTEEIRTDITERIGKIEMPI